jgi:predicted nucleic-acid-binding protein
MIALDSNVLIRLLVEDDPIQANRARRLLESTQERGEQCFISDPVLCEVEWVLLGAYGAARRDVATAIQHILTSALFVVEDAASVQRSVDRFSRGRGDFSGYLIGVRGQKQGARTTFTYDRDLRDEEGFTLLN